MEDLSKSVTDLLVRQKQVDASKILFLRGWVELGESVNQRLEIRVVAEVLFEQKINSFLGLSSCGCFCWLGFCVAVS